VQPPGGEAAAPASRDPAAMTDTATKAVINGAVFIFLLLERAAYPRESGLQQV